MEVEMYFTNSNELHTNFLTTKFMMKCFKGPYFRLSSGSSPKNRKKQEIFRKKQEKTEEKVKKKNVTRSL